MKNDIWAHIAVLKGMWLMGASVLEMTDNSELSFHTIFTKIKEFEQCHKLKK